MGHVIRDLDVGALWIHRLRERGGGSLPAADAVDELIDLATHRGTTIHEPFAGSSAFADALQIVGPTPEYYAELVAAQLDDSAQRAPGGRLIEAARQLGQRFLAALPVEVPF
jgi:hypothetical protein